MDRCHGTTHVAMVGEVRCRRQAGHAGYCRWWDKTHPLETFGTAGTAPVVTTEPTDLQALEALFGAEKLAEYVGIGRRSIEAGIA